MRRSIPLFILLMVLLWTQPADAQGQGTPILLLVKGDYIAFYPEPEPGVLSLLTEDEGHRGLALSPDGTHFAFNTLSAITRAVVGTERVYEPGLPEDIATHEQIVVSAQPADAVFQGAGQPGRGLLRSLPAWSSDGADLAWTESALEDPSGDSHLIIYDLASGQMHRPAQFPASPDRDLPRVYTVDAGLVVEYTDATGAVQLALYTSGGTLLNTINLPSPETLLNWRLVDGPWQMAYVQSLGADGNGTFTMVDMLSGSEHPPYPVPLRMTAASAPEDSFSVEMDYSEAGIDSYLLLIERGGGYNTDVILQPDAFALSPDGGSIAYIALENPSDTSQSELRILDGSNTMHTLSPYAEIQALAWSPMRWSFPESASPCDNLSPRLQRGGRGVVLPGLANRLRAEPTTDSLQRGLLEAGAQFTALAGPVCEGTFVWWLVQAQDMLGWTVEGQDNTYFVEPLP